ncbi:MAG: hypothetical protein WHT81_02155 [Rectinemataceae bacterium]
MKLLVIMRPSEDQITYHENELRYARMMGIFLGAGFDAAFRYARSMEDLDSALAETEPDMVFCGIDHLPRSIGPEQAPQDESATVNIHEYFEECAIPYIGQTPDVIELALSKAALKRRWQAAGVNTPSFTVVEAGQNQPHNLDALADYPYLLKPENLGNSRLISESSIAYSAEDIQRIMSSLRREYDGAVLIEHYLGDCPDVQEITCAMIECEGAMVCMPMRLGFAMPKQHHLITAEDKDRHRTVITPLQPELYEAAARFAAEAFRAAGVRDYARGDFFFAGGAFHAIEINGQPMIPDRWFEGCARFSGLGEAQYLVGIVAAGWERLTREGRLHEPLPEGARALLAPLRHLSMKIAGAWGARHE